MAGREEEVNCCRSNAKARKGDRKKAYAGRIRPIEHEEGMVGQRNPRRKRKRKIQKARKASKKLTTRRKRKNRERGKTTLRAFRSDDSMGNGRKTKV
jgi:hypothetical protein